jgi:hypothetical protein
LQKILQLRRLHEQSQPLEQLDEVIEKIRRLMVESAETASKEKLGRKVAAAAAAEATTVEDGADEAPEICLGSRRISTAESGSS